MVEYKIRCPQNPQEFLERDQLLMRLLRPFPQSLPIAKEYPLVLDPRAPFSSHCTYDGHGKLLAHLNYQPKTVIKRDGQKIGTIALVGNVATDDKVQGRGIMGRMLKTMQTRVKLEGALGMLLWSDLERYYQNLGFKEVGKELRITIQVSQVKAALLSKLTLEDYSFYEDLTVFATSHQPLNATILEKMLHHRYAVPQTLHRTLDEYKVLSVIPNTMVAFSQKGEKIEYGFMNRGSDLIKTLHEWGATSPTRLVLIGLKLAESCRFDDFLILAPGSLTGEFRDCFSKFAESVTAHHLGLLWPNPLMEVQKNPIDWEEFFVWGFDSI